MRRFFRDFYFAPAVIFILAWVGGFCFGFLLRKGC